MIMMGFERDLVSEAEEGRASRTVPLALGLLDETHTLKVIPFNRTL